MKEWEAARVSAQATSTYGTKSTILTNKLSPMSLHAEPPPLRYSNPSTTTTEHMILLSHADKINISTLGHMINCSSCLS